MSVQRVLALVLGGGRGTRLFPLTRDRSKPAVPLAGKYRIIDVPLSNCINSGVQRIYVLTQFNSVSLHRHIRRTYTFDPFNGGFVEILAAQQTNDNAGWYQGTADAVRKQLRRLAAWNEPSGLISMQPTAPALGRLSRKLPTKRGRKPLASAGRAAMRRKPARRLRSSAAVWAIRSSPTKARSPSA